MRVNWLAENSRLPCAGLPLPCDDASESDEEDRDGEEAMDMRLDVLRNSCANGGINIKKKVQEWFKTLQGRCFFFLKKKRIRILETTRKKKKEKKEPKGVTMAEAET